MTKIRAVDLYKIIFNNLNFINETSLTHLYLPLIGAKAYKLYLWLRSELLLGINSTDSFEQNHNRILSYLKLDINEFNELKQILEEYGLLKTYYDDVNNHYLYFLQKPLEIDEFKSNLVFINKLIKAIGKEEYEKTLMFLKPVVLDGIYENISHELFLYDENKEESEFNNSHIYLFDFNKLFSDLIKDNVILDLNDDEHNLIETYFKSKQFSYLDILNATKNSLKIVQNKTALYGLNISLFQNFMKNLNLNYDSKKQLEVIEASNNTKEISSNQNNLRNIELFKNFDFDEKSKKEIFDWYENYSFNQFYKIVIKDEPNAYTLKNMNEVIKKYGFNNLIINLIADFVIFETSKFNLNYFKKVCQTINNLNLKNENDILNHLRNFKLGNKFHNPKLNNNFKKENINETNDLEKTNNSNEEFNLSLFLEHLND